MNKLCSAVGRNSLLKNRLLCPAMDFKNKSSSSSSDSDNESKEKPIKKTPNAEALNKLNALLQKIVTEDTNISDGKLKLARPTRRVRNPEAYKKVESEETQMMNAVKEVASSIGGDAKQTESELVSKLLNPDQEGKPAKTYNLEEIVKGMKIDREPVAEKSRADQVKQILNRVNSDDRNFQSQQYERSGPRRPRTAPPRRGPELVVEKIDLLGGTPLGIFTKPDELKEGFQNATWNELYQRDLKLSVTHPPANYFQQMILWTEQGKIWKFPIDNEQGWEKEKTVCFSEHVFLEKHLESWCPQKGPIRHFMELVCVGLSKNHYITVETKIEHINWYKNYFDEKRKLLLDVGAIPVEGEKQQKRLEK